MLVPSFLALAALAYLLTAYPTTLRSDVAARWSLSSDRLYPETWLTYAVLHNGFWHLAVNAVLLWLAGGMVERTVGTRRTLWLVIGATLLAGMAEVLFDPQARSGVVGASGTVAGCFAAALVLDPRAEVQFCDVGLQGVQRLAGEKGVLLAWFGAAALAASVVLDWSLPGFRTAHAAHLAGALYGGLMGWYCRSSRSAESP